VAENCKGKEKGKLVSWDKQIAALRVPVKPLSYLEAELLLIEELNLLVNEENKGGR